MKFISKDKSILRNLKIHKADLTDSSALNRVVRQIKPDEVYNLAAQSHIGVSYEEPEYTANSDALGVLRLLNSIKNLNSDKVKFFQSSTSEIPYMIKMNQIDQNRQPSPYEISKLFAYWTTVNYREAYDMFCCNGILFNHESPLRGETFVTRKITRALSRIKLGLQDTLYLGNLDAKRDWGHAQDVVKAIWLMMQQDKPDDFVIATGKQHSVRDFVNESAKSLDMKITWKGEGIDEKAFDEKGRNIVSVERKFFRTNDFSSTFSNMNNLKNKLGWQPKITFKELVNEMSLNDLNLLKDNPL